MIRERELFLICKTLNTISVILRKNHGKVGDLSFTIATRKFSRRMCNVLGKKNVTVKQLFYIYLTFNFSRSAIIDFKNELIKKWNVCYYKN